jgi:hypothetical protein
MIEKVFAVLSLFGSCVSQLAGVEGPGKMLELE